MADQTKLTFPELISASVRSNYNCDALAYAGETPITYGELEDQVLALISYFEKLGLQQGDKIAILSANMPNWGIAYLAITFMGAVTVPLLPDFHPNDIKNILDHSEVKAILISENLVHKIDNLASEHLKTRIKLDDFSLIGDISMSTDYQKEARPVGQYTVEEDDLAAIIYTSGTTGKSKGVMLTHKNICSNAIAGGIVQPIDETDRCLSLLPLSHTYENTLGLVLPLLGGACIYYLRKPPTPVVLLPALKEIKPTIILSVPLIIEKIYRNKVLPTFTGSKLMRTLYRIGPVRKFLNKLAGKKLLATFGGELKFFGVGGAKLDATVEKFLQEARFPYAIGYGLTETAPLLAGVNPRTIRLESTGPAVEGVELKINNPDKDTGEGEIWAKGPNIMKGYYKEPELTADMITPDGWLKTGDLGVFDKDNFLFIKGRLKNMIVGANGENIYPEEIESVINNFNYVSESLVVEEKGKLVALVHFNKEELEEKYQHLKHEVTDYVEHKTEELIIDLKKYVNARVNKFSQLQLVVVQHDPFQKTATQKIKRFLYYKSPITNH